jgi:predicted glycosyltransferase
LARSRRIVCYAINGSGLGHVTRLCAIARWIRRLLMLNDARVPELLFLSSSEAPELLAQHGFPVFKLPSKTAIRAAGLDVAEYRRLAKHFVWSCLGTFNPELLLVDTFPSGSFDELLQVLDGPFAKCLVMRRVKPEFARRPVFRAALSLYDKVLLPHTRDDAEYGELPSGAVFCGEVVQLDRAEAYSREALLQMLGVDARMRLIYVSAGGGGDPDSEAMLERIISSFAAREDCFLLVGAGPLYRGRRKQGERLCWWTQSGVARAFAACDLAICAAGYNTFHELLHLGVPSIFFAQEKVADEQEQRVRAAVEAGACLAWDGVDTDALQELVEQAGREAETLRAAAMKRFSHNGARACAEQVLSALLSRERLRWLSQVCTPRLATLLDRFDPESGVQLCRLLGRLVPVDLSAEELEQGALLRLRSSLSEAARAELDAAVEQHKQSGSVHELVQRFCALVEGLGERPDLESLASAFDLLMRKQPLEQQSSPAWAPWVSTIIDGVERALQTHAFDTQEVLRLLRVFPRLVDAEAAEAMALFAEYLERSRGRAPHELLKELQVLKLMHRRVEKLHLQELLAGAG